MSFYLALVSPLDAPLYELAFTTSRSTPAQQQSSGNASTSSFPSWSTFTSMNGGELSQPAEKGMNGNAGFTAPSSGSEKERHMCQMVVHMGLDSIEEVMEGTGNLYLKSVDKHNEWSVSAFLAGSVKFVLLHDAKNEEGIRLFFLEVWEAYVKVLLNPFHTVNTPIRNPFFDAKIRASARRNL